jgi:hypothetical protein
VTVLGVPIRVRHATEPDHLMPILPHFDGCGLPGYGIHVALAAPRLIDSTSSPILLDLCKSVSHAKANTDEERHKHGTSREVL